jgi:hypothetical protein
MANNKKQNGQENWSAINNSTPVTGLSVLASYDGGTGTTNFIGYSSSSTDNGVSATYLSSVLPLTSAPTGGIGVTTTTAWHPSCWDYWQHWHYPQVILPSYPVYLQDRAKDNAKQAFEVLKILMDKKLLKVEKVGDFIEAMDALIKVL